MLLLLLTACDPGFRDRVDVLVVEEAVALYSAEAPGVVTVSIRGAEPRAIGLLCGGRVGMEYSFEDGGIGCGSAGEAVAAALWPITAFADPEDLIADGCGSWAGETFVTPEGEPDFVATDTMFDPDDENATHCGGNASASLDLGIEVMD